MALGGIMGRVLTRRVAVLVAVIVTFSVVLVAANDRGTAHAATKPNVIVITVDDMRADEMWVLPKTRALIGDVGTTFTNSFVSTSLCCPSRAGFLSGQYATNNGIGNNDSWSHFDAKNQIGKWLQGGGYYTSLIGKYLNKYACKNGKQPGWDHWQALCAKIYNQYGYSIRDNDSTVVYPTLGDAAYQTDVIANRAVSTMQEARTSGKPYFLWLTPTAPHTGAGNNFPSRYAKNALDTWPLPKPPAYDEADVTDKPAYIQSLLPITTKKTNFIQKSERVRLKKLLAIDDLVEKVVQDAAANGELDNTVIMFTSDNGYLNGEHRIIQGKEVEYEESLRVPLVVRGPGVPVSTNPSPVVNTDFASTISQIAGVTPGRAQDGQSWWDTLTGAPFSNRRAVFHTIHKDKATEADGPAHPGGFGVRAGRFTYFELSTGERELYNHATDPYELNNEVNDPKRARVVDQYASVLQTLRGCAGATCHVTVPNLAPTAAATYGCVDLMCFFDGTDSSDAEGGVTYSWNFGDGGTATGATPQHSFAGSGTRTVTLTVTDDEGATDTFAMQVTVRAGNLSPIADFTGTCTGLACTFDGSPAHDIDGSIVSYAWSFDDGATGAGSPVDHTFAADGTYNVTLTVTDDRGGTNAVTIPFTVEAPNEPPVPVIDYSCTGVTCSFSAAGSTDADDPIVLYEWDFGDGLAEDGVTVDHTYSLVQTYNVILRVTDARGKSTSTSVSVTL
jgi:N-acetylglucosamine-6-sulfatase